MDDLRDIVAGEAGYVANLSPAISSYRSPEVDRSTPPLRARAIDPGYESILRAHLAREEAPVAVTDGRVERLDGLPEATRAAIVQALEGTLEPDLLHRALPSIWVLTPGRDDVFAFLMDAHHGFVHLWPRPRLQPVSQRVQRESMHRSSPKPPRIAVPDIPLALGIAHVTGPEGTAGRFAGVHRAALGRRRTESPQRHVHRDHLSSVRSVSTEQQAPSSVEFARDPTHLAVELDAARRHQRLLGERAAWVVPVTLHAADPDLHGVIEDGDATILRVRRSASLKAFDHHPGRHH